MIGRERVEAFFCPYDDMANRVMQAAAKHGPRARIVSADHTFLVDPTAYGRDTSGALVSVLVVVHIS